MTWTLRILDTASVTFSSGPTMGVGRSGCAVAALDERRVLVAGGFDGCRRVGFLVEPRQWIIVGVLFDALHIRFPQ